MAAFTFFNGFVGRLGLGEIDLNTDTLRAYLSGTAPSASGHNTKANLAEISVGNGYASGGEYIQNAYSQTAGVGTMTGEDVEWEASGGAIGPFRYVVLYDDTHADDALVGWWDYGEAVTLNEGEKFTAKIGASVLTIEAE